MTLLQSGLAKSAAADDYTIDSSLRFDEGASGGLLSKTQVAPSGSRAFTYSFWFKGKTDIGGLTGNYDWDFLDCVSADNDIISFGRNDPRLYFAIAGTPMRVTTEKFRDPSSWYHLVVAFNSKEDVANDRIKIYKNGVQITAFDTLANPAKNYELVNFNTSGTSVRIGNQDGTYPGGCYMAEVYFIDGAQLDADDFGELDSDTNQWKPLDSDDVKDAVTFGANGFYQNYSSAELANSFTDSSSSDHTITANGDVKNVRG